MDTDLARAFSLIRQLQGALNGKTFRAGAFSGTTNGSGEVVITVPHGMSNIPTAVLLTTNSSSGVQITARAINVGATTFDAYVVRSAAAAISVGGYWVAIG
jgi:hypothetical protein